MGEFTLVEGGTVYEDNGYSYMIGYYFDEKRKESFYILFNQTSKQIIPGKRMRSLYSIAELEQINSFVCSAVKGILHSFRSIHSWNGENLESG